MDESEHQPEPEEHPFSPARELHLNAPQERDWNERPPPPSPAGGAGPVGRGLSFGAGVGGPHLPAVSGSTEASFDQVQGTTGAIGPDGRTSWVPSLQTFGTSARKLQQANEQALGLPPHGAPTQGTSSVGAAAVSPRLRQTATRSGSVDLVGLAFQNTPGPATTGGAGGVFRRTMKIAQGIIPGAGANASSPGSSASGVGSFAQTTASKFGPASAISTGVGGAGGAAPAPGGGSVLAVGAPGPAAYESVPHQEKLDHRATDQDHGHGGPQLLTGDPYNLNTNTPQQVVTKVASSALSAMRSSNFADVGAPPGPASSREHHHHVGTSPHGILPGAPTGSLQTQSLNTQQRMAANITSSNTTTTETAKGLTRMASRGVLGALRAGKQVSSGGFFARSTSEFRRDTYGLLTNCFRRIPVITFYSAENKQMDRVLVIAALVIAIRVPMAVAFGQLVPEVLYLEDGSFGAILEFLCDFVYIVYMPVRFFISVGDLTTGKEIDGRAQILEFQLTSASFYLDVASLLPIVISVGGEALADLFSPGLLLLKTLRCHRLVRLPQSHFELEYNQAIQLMRMILWMLLLFHMICCTWFYIIHSRDKVDALIFAHSGPAAAASAAERERYYSDAQFRLYIYCFRDAIYLMNGESRDDRNYENNVELLFMGLVGAFGGPFFAVVYAHMTIFLERVGSLANKHTEQMSLIRAAMKSLSVPKDLEQRITKYHTFLAIHHNLHAYNTLMQGLSVSLFVELKAFLFRKLFENAPFFRTAPMEFVHTLILVLVEVTFSPGDLIVRQGDIGEEMYFIIRGTCDVLNAEWDTVRSLRENDYFGEIALLAQTPRLCSVRASTYCLLAEITREKFMPILEQFPEQREAIIENLQKYIMRGTPGGVVVSSDSVTDFDDHVRRLNTAAAGYGDNLHGDAYDLMLGGGGASRRSHPAGGSAGDAKTDRTSRRDMMTGMLTDMENKERRKSAGVAPTISTGGGGTSVDGGVWPVNVGGAMSLNKGPGEHTHSTRAKSLSRVTQIADRVTQMLPQMMVSTRRDQGIGSAAVPGSYRGARSGIGSVAFGPVAAGANRGVAAPASSPLGIPVPVVPLRSGGTTLGADSAMQKTRSTLGFENKPAATKQLSSTDNATGGGGLKKMPSLLELPSGSISPSNSAASANQNKMFGGGPGPGSAAPGGGSPSNQNAASRTLDPRGTVQVPETQREKIRFHQPDMLQAGAIAEEEEEEEEAELDGASKCASILSREPSATAGQFLVVEKVSSRDSNSPTTQQQQATESLSRSGSRIPQSSASTNSQAAAANAEITALARKSMLVAASRERSRSQAVVETATGKRPTLIARGTSFTSGRAAKQTSMVSRMQSDSCATSNRQSVAYPAQCLVSRKSLFANGAAGETGRRGSLGMADEMAPDYDDVGVRVRQTLNAAAIQAVEDGAVHRESRLTLAFSAQKSHARKMIKKAQSDNTGATNSEERNVRGSIASAIALVRRPSAAGLQRTANAVHYAAPFSSLSLLNGESRQLADSIRQLLRDELCKLMIDHRSSTEDMLTTFLDDFLVEMKEMLVGFLKGEIDMDVDDGDGADDADDAGGGAGSMMSSINHYISKQLSELEEDCSADDREVSADNSAVEGVEHDGAHRGPSNPGGDQQGLEPSTTEDGEEQVGSTS